MISLERRNGRPLRIGHRGAATLGPANTLASFRLALETGVDLIEFDVVSKPGSGLVVSHSVREIQPETPPLDEVLRFFVDEAPDTGVHLDLKQAGRESDVVEALRRFGLSERSVRQLGVREHVAPDLRAGWSPRRDHDSEKRLQDLRGRTQRADRPHGTARGSSPQPRSRSSDPRVYAGEALVLHHSVVTSGSVRAAHACGVPVVTWTVDDRRELARVDEAGVDAIVTNDPRLFLPS